MVEEEGKRTDCKSSAQSHSSVCPRGPMDRWKWPRELWPAHRNSLSCNSSRHVARLCRNFEGTWEVRVGDK